MNTPAFDTLETAEKLAGAGIDESHAKAIVSTLRRAVAADRDTPATKTDLANLRANLRADLYRALWIQTGAIVGTVIASAGVVIAVAG